MEAIREYMALCSCILLSHHLDIRVSQMHSVVMYIVAGVIKPCNSIFGENYFFIQTCSYETRFCPVQITDFNLKR